MTVAEIDIYADPVRAIPVPATAVDALLLQGPCELVGFSFREASGDNPGQGSGSVTSPAAGATICSTATLAAGVYDVSWLVSLAGTIAAADANNFQLVAAGAGIINSVNPAVAGNYPQPVVRVTMAVSGLIKVVAQNLATVGAIYSANLDAIPTSASEAVLELQDGNNALAEMSLAGNGSDSRWYGSGGLKVRNRINLHMVSGTVTGAVYARYSKNTG